MKFYIKYIYPIVMGMGLAMTFLIPIGFAVHAITNSYAVGYKELFSLSFDGLTIMIVADWLRLSYKSIMSE